LEEQSRPLKVLITGAYGLIGNRVYAHLAEQPAAYDSYGMVRRAQPSARTAALHSSQIPAEKLRLADLTDFSAVQRAVDAMDVVVHMAADPDGRAGWESVLNNNIVGSYHLFDASRLAGVKRVIYASTNQVVFGFRVDEPYHLLFAGRYDDPALDAFHPIDHTQPARPLNYYSCSKVFGEALAHMYMPTCMAYRASACGSAGSPTTTNCRTRMRGSCSAANATSSNWSSAASTRPAACASTHFLANPTTNTTWWISSMPRMC